MSADCYCDYEPSLFYRAKVRTAAKPHRCYECGGPIMPAERYEAAAGHSDGFWAAKTCPRCLDLREWVSAHVPCFCIMHGNVLDDAYETVRETILDLGADECEGLFFGYARRRIAIKRWCAQHRRSKDRPSAFREEANR